VSHASALPPHCNTLQHTATHCNTLFTLFCVTRLSLATTLQHTATHCNTLFTLFCVTRLSLATTQRCLVTNKFCIPHCNMPVEHRATRRLPCCQPRRLGTTICTSCLRNVTHSQLYHHSSNLRLHLAMTCRCMCMFEQVAAE